uniref:Uncharacterized protein n=1 Tax=Knipowitschia caucasica TaxID=637954 RepID=A0AAV2L8U6_KNICA
MEPSQPQGPGRAEMEPSQPQGPGRAEMEPPQPQGPGRAEMEPSQPQGPGQAEMEPSQPQGPGEAEMEPSQPQGPGRAEMEPSQPQGPGRAEMEPSQPQGPGRAEMEPSQPQGPGRAEMEPSQPQGPGRAEKEPSQPQGPGRAEMEPSQPQGPGRAEMEPSQPQGPGRAEMEPSQPQGPGRAEMEPSQPQGPGRAEMEPSQPQGPGRAEMEPSPPQGPGRAEMEPSQPQGPRRAEMEPSQPQGPGRAEMEPSQPQTQDTGLIKQPTTQRSHLVLRSISQRRLAPLVHSFWDTMETADLSQREARARVAQLFLDIVTTACQEVLVVFKDFVSGSSPAEAPAVTQSSVKRALWGHMFKSRCCRPREESESQLLDLASLEVANQVNTTLSQDQDQEDQQKARTTEPQEEVTKSQRLRIMEALRKYCPCLCPQSSPGPQDRSLRSTEQPGLEDYSQDPLRSTEQDYSQDLHQDLHQDLQQEKQQAQMQQSSSYSLTADPVRVRDLLELEAVKMSGDDLSEASLVQRSPDTAPAELLLEERLGEGGPLEAVLVQDTKTEARPQKNKFLCRSCCASNCLKKLARKLCGPTLTTPPRDTLQEASVPEEVKLKEEEEVKLKEEEVKLKEEEPELDEKAQALEEFALLLANPQKEVQCVPGGPFEQEVQCVPGGPFKQEVQCVPGGPFEQEVQCVAGGPSEQWDLPHVVGLVYELVSRILQTNKFVDLKDLSAALLQKLHQQMKDWKIKVKADTVHIKEVSKRVYRDLCLGRPRNWVTLDSLIRQDYLEEIVLTIRRYLV